MSDGLPAWTPFERARIPEPDEATIDAWASDLGCCREDVTRIFAELLSQEIYKNSRYQVMIKRGEPMLWVSIKRLDRAPMGPERFWDFQRIKDELVGPMHEGAEIYPSRDRLVDTANQYHMFVFADPTVRFPFGWTDGLIATDGIGGSRQKPFEEQ